MKSLDKVTAPDLVSALTFVGLMLLGWSLSEYILPLLVFITPGNITLDPLLESRIRGAFLVFTLLACLPLTALVNVHLSLNERARALAKEMMSDLLLSREQFRVLYDNSPMPYFLMSIEGVIHNPNKAALRFFGGTMERVSGLDMYEVLVAESDDNKTLALLRSKIERGVPISRQEVQVKTLSGDVRWVQLSIFTLEQQTPLAQHKLVSFVDMTEEKEIDRIKTDFVSLASHQLRTPLTAVKWYVDLLLTSTSLQVSPEVQVYLEKIYQGNQRMIDLVSTLLNVSRIEMGTVPVDITAVSLPELCKDVLDEVSEAAAEKQLHIEHDTTRAHEARTDRTLLRVGIQNLLTNAIRYTPANGRVTLEAVSSPTGHVLKVTDTGMGIPPEAHAKLFSKMYRAENAKKAEAKGTGLGLYMTKAFVEKIGGSIEFTSILGQGTTFTITLPITPPSNV